MSYHSRGHLSVLGRHLLPKLITRPNPYNFLGKIRVWGCIILSMCSFSVEILCIFLPLPPKNLFIVALVFKVRSCQHPVNVVSTVFDLPAVMFSL